MCIKRKLLLSSITMHTYIVIYGQPQRDKGYPVKDAHLDILPGFINPPEGYGNVPFYWWNGDTYVNRCSQIV